MRKILALGTTMQMISLTIALAQTGQHSPAKHTTTANPNASDPVASFRVIVGAFTSFFGGQPRLMVIQDKPPAGLFYVLAISAKNISFDVTKTDSLVTPDVGMIDMQVSATSNAVCGDFFGWSKVEGALAAAKRSDCFRPWPPLSGESEQAEFDVELKFGFQEGRWVILHEAGTGLGIFDSLFYGDPDPKIDFSEPAAAAMNAPWLALRRLGMHSSRTSLLRR